MIDQQLKLKYPRLNIVEDYPDGAMIMLDWQQCFELEQVIQEALAFKKMNKTTKQWYAFPIQLRDYLSTKEKL